MITASPSINRVNLLALFMLSLLLVLQSATTLAEAEQTTGAQKTENTEPAEQTEEKKAPEPKINRPRVTAPTHQLVNQWLVNRTPKDQLRWLTDTGLEKTSPDADEAGKVPFLALHAKERYGKPKGAVILLHADGQRAGWPDSLLALHEQLPDSGWHSLFISLPPPQVKPVPKRSDPHPLLANLAKKDEPQPSEGEEKKDAKEQGPKKEDESKEANDENTGLSDEEIDKLEQDEAGEASTEEKAKTAENDTKVAENQGNSAQTEQNKPKVPEIPVEQEIQKRIQAAINYLNKAGQFNLVLVGHGSAAIHAATYIATMPRPSEPGRFAAIQAGVFMNANNTQYGTTQNLPDQVNKLNMPVLDIIDQKNEGIKRQAVTRLKNIPRLKRKTYQHVVMPTTRSFDPNRTATGHNSDRMAKRIRGWIEKKVSGQEMGAVMEP